MIERVRSFLAELRRRKVYHVGVVYVMVAFLVWQIADIALPSLGLPETAVGIVLVVTALGFPIALVLAWAYEVRPEERLVSLDESRAQPVVGESDAQPVVGQPDALATSRPPSVAILPFENMSSEEESGYFADGVTEEITNVLAGVADLHVAARTSAFAFKESRVDIREIGRKLNVSYVVEGSVRRAGTTRLVPSHRAALRLPSADSFLSSRLAHRILASLRKLRFETTGPT